MNYAKKIDMCKGTDELRTAILNNPTLPIVVLTDSEVIADSDGYWYGSNISFCIKDLLELKGGYYNDGQIIDDKSDLEYYLSDHLCEEEWTKGLTDEEYNKMIKEEVKKYDNLWTRCIVIYSST